MDDAGTIDAVCLSECKGERKTAVGSASLRTDHGITGDAHAGKWHRQVSLLAAEDIRMMREKGLSALSPGDFAENLVVSRLDLGALGLGSRIGIGTDVEISLTQIGKVCHTRCQIFYTTGDCIMPRRGLFARVLAGGDISVGDRVVVSKAVPRDLLQCVVLAVREGDLDDDVEAGVCGAVATRLSCRLPCHVYAKRLVSRDNAEMTRALRHYCDGHSIDLVVITSASGSSSAEAVTEVLTATVERTAPDVEHAIAGVRARHTPAASEPPLLSSGIRGSTLIVSLTEAREPALAEQDNVLPAIAHACRELRDHRAQEPGTSIP